jgi:hypothetical protein
MNQSRDEIVSGCGDRTFVPVTCEVQWELTYPKRQTCPQKAMPIAKTTKTLPASPPKATGASSGQ